MSETAVGGGNPHRPHGRSCIVFAGAEDSIASTHMFRRVEALPKEPFCHMAAGMMILPTEPPCVLGFERVHAWSITTQPGACPIVQRGLFFFHSPQHAGSWVVFFFSFFHSAFFPPTSPPWPPPLPDMTFRRFCGCMDDM